ncbi:hypothetical protein D1AOALGA4SA_10309, partial [Olavius algarvensis Delta 1 endosymbiont]
MQLISVEIIRLNSTLRIVLRH